MIRFLLRSAGYLVVAGGFVLLVLDGARSIANQSLLITRLGDTGMAFFGERYAQLQPMIERQIHPLLWDPVLVHLLMLPTCATLLFLGFLLLRLGRQPEPGIGILTRA